MCQRGYGRGYCAVIERSRGFGYRWVPVDSLGKWKLGVEGRWKEGRTYAHCWAGLTASLECVRWTRATLPVSDSWRQSARRGLRREGALRAVDPAGSSLTDAEWRQTRMMRTRLGFGWVRLWRNMGLDLQEVERCAPCNREDLNAVAKIATN